MTSLMQGFAKARQTRLQERAKAIDELNTWRTQRSLQFQQEVIATRTMLAHETKQRLSVAHIEQIQRLQEVQQRAVTAKAKLAQLTADRLALAFEAQTQRQQEFQALQVQGKEFLATVKSDRLAMAAKLKQELSDYVSYIHLSVWGMDFINVLAESRSQSPIISPTAVAPSISIEEFIETYINTLEGTPTLPQVVNDREAVKDLLTTGASILKVDPSEILNTLIKMVDLDN